MTGAAHTAVHFLFPQVNFRIHFELVPGNYMHISKKVEETRLQ